MACATPATASSARRATSGNWRHDLVEQEHVWGKAIHRIVTENITEEQAVDEAIARIKQILSE